MRSKLTPHEPVIVARYLAGENCREIAPDFECDKGTIRSALLRNGVVLRSKSETASSKRQSVISDSQHQVIEGMLLGDASVFRRRANAVFRHKSSQEEFVRHVAGLLPFEFGFYSEPAREVSIRGKVCHRSAAHIAESRVDVSLNEYRNRWYSGTKKVVPENLVLTPTVCKYWYYSDGYSSWNGDNCVIVGLCTNSFTRAECEALQGSLAALGFDFKIAKKLNGHILQGRKKDAVNGFLGFIGPSELDCYRYKWKCHEGTRPCRGY
jgi:hypothetical protein